MDETLKALQFKTILISTYLGYIKILNYVELITWMRKKALNQEIGLLWIILM